MYLHLVLQNGGGDNAFKKSNGQTKYQEGMI